MATTICGGALRKRNEILLSVSIASNFNGDEFYIIFLHGIA